MSWPVQLSVEGFEKLRHSIVQLGELGIASAGGRGTLFGGTAAVI